MIQLNQQPTSSAESDLAFVRFQIGQSLETYRTQFALMTQILTVLVVANVTLIGYALTSKTSAVVLVSAVFPIMSLYLMMVFTRNLASAIYTAVNLEAKFGAPNTDWLATTFVTTTLSRKALKSLREIMDIEDPQLRMERLGRLQIVVTGRSRGLSRTLFALAAFGQIVGSIILSLFFQWHWF